MSPDATVGFIYGAAAAACLIVAAVALYYPQLDGMLRRYQSWVAGRGDSFDRHCDDVAALFGPVVPDELAQRREAHR